MNDQEKLMSVFAQAYQLIAKQMKQTPSKEGFQQILQMLGEDGIQACAEVADQGPEAVAQTMVEVIQTKQTQKAAKGAKLNRIMALNNACPEGYMKKGGKCKKCEKGDKFNIKSGVFHITDYFKNGNVVKYQNPARSLRMYSPGNLNQVAKQAPAGSVVSPSKTSKGVSATKVQEPGRYENGVWTERTQYVPNRPVPLTGDAPAIGVGLAAGGMAGATSNLMRSLPKTTSKVVKVMREAAPYVMGSIAGWGEAQRQKRTK